MICVRCKNVIPEGSVFCPLCGYKLQASYPDVWHNSQIPFDINMPDPPPSEAPLAVPLEQMAGQIQMTSSLDIPEPVTQMTPLKKYAQFSGRSRRKEYWLWVLLNAFIEVIATMLFLLITLSLYDISSGNISSGLCVIALLILHIFYHSWHLAIFIPNLAVSVRRLHDTGRSGWNVLWWYLPAIIGILIILLIEVFEFFNPVLLIFSITLNLTSFIIWLVQTVQDSQPGPNKYGYNPKGVGNVLHPHPER